MHRFICLISVLLLSTSVMFAQDDEQPEPETQQYIYVLKLIPRLMEVSNWTEADNKIVAEHFTRLQQHTEDGKVILAGRTQGMTEEDFGIVIFEAASEEEAHTFMEQDPTVRDGIMTATLFPYRVALMRQG